MKSLRHCFSLLILLVPTLEISAWISYSSDEYWARRNEIIAEEARNSLGGNLQLCDDEEAANEVLMAAKNAEIDAGFKNLSTFLPTRNFLSVQEDIALSSTFRIIKKLPKGAVLHLHDISFTSAKYVFETITFRDNLYVCLPEDGSVGYRFMNSADDDSSCTSSTGWQLLADLRADETIADEVNTKIKNSITLVVPDLINSRYNIDEAWDVANQVFRTLSQLVTYLPVLQDYYYQGLTELYEDNVLWAELRTNFPTLYDLNGATYGPLEVAQLYKETTDRFVSDHLDFVGAKMIYTPVRTTTPSEFDECLEIAELLVKKLPDFVIGFDIDGEEAKGNPLIVYADRLRHLSFDIRFFFHAGETQWNGLSTDRNLIDAVLLNTTRIGHGFAITKHPKILQIVKKRDIAIEVNPVSNQVLALVDDMRNHPASYLFAENFPIVVSCDNPGIWGSVALSYDFYEAFVGIMSRSADIRALKQLAINSIKYSAMSETERDLAYRIWEEKWAAAVAELASSTLQRIHDTWNRS